MTVRSPACERARAWVPRELDGELNEFCRVGLRHHLARCVECSRYAADVEWFTALLRDAPLEPYSCNAATFHRRRQRRVLRVVPSVAALALVATITATAVSIELGRDNGRSPEPSNSVPATTLPELGAQVQVLLRPLKLPIGQRSAVDDF